LLPLLWLPVARRKKLLLQPLRLPPRLLRLPLLPPLPPWPTLLPLLLPLRPLPPTLLLPLPPLLHRSNQPLPVDEKAAHRGGFFASVS
jgi:hypothetical protein